MRLNVASDSSKYFIATLKWSSGHFGGVVNHVSRVTSTDCKLWDGTALMLFSFLDQKPFAF